ncbi:MAG: hypothetical protein EU550_02440 [Promethearchaeota archaeon]|nr:MAG: hypothetical protein EU550_02440 [Candidatus Lokiarchaeota archaeon]
MSFADKNLGFNEKLGILFNSINMDELKDLIRDYNDYCVKNDMKENKIKGYSKYKKSELADFVIMSLPDDEKKRILKKLEESTIKGLYQGGMDLFAGKDSRESIKEKKEMIKPEKGYIYKIKGFNWENETNIFLTKDNRIEGFDCTCRSGQYGGLCIHFFAGLIDLIKEKVIDPDSLEFFFRMPTVDVEKIEEKEDKIEGKAEKIIQAPNIEKIANLKDNENNKVYISDAKILEINNFQSKYQDHVSTTYILTVEGGLVASDNKKSTEKIEFEKINARCSENAMNKYKLKVGDKISFNGRFKKHNRFGFLIQNIRKFTKK